METQEVTLHNELKRKSIFLRDFTTAAQMLWQVLRRCFDSCCADASADASAGASAVAAQMLRQLLHRYFDRCCADASTVAAQLLRQLLRPGCERCLACGHRSGVNAGIRGMDGVAGNKLSINEISILVVRYWAPRECLC